MSDMNYSNIGESSVPESTPISKFIYVIIIVFCEYRLRSPIREAYINYTCSKNPDQLVINFTTEYYIACYIMPIIIGIFICCMLALVNKLRKYLVRPV